MNLDEMFEAALRRIYKRIDYRALLAKGVHPHTAARSVGQRYKRKKQ